MSEPAYPAARAVAPKVQAHFARHLEVARAHGREDLPEAPGESALEALIDAAFWASLRREEGITPTISLALVPPDRAGHPLRFAEPIPLRPALLAKVAPAVQRPGIHLGVWSHGDEFHVWGTTRDVPAFCLVVEVVASGLLVIKHRSDPFGKFVNVAVLEGDQVKVVDAPGGAAVPDCPQLVKSLLGFVEGLAAPDKVNVLVEVAASMRAHGRGGALLVVPADTEQWRESVVSPLLYAIAPPFKGLTDLLKGKPKGFGQAIHHEWQEDLRRVIEAIAGLTAVDGATVVNDRYEVLALGAKITRRRGSPPVEQVSHTEPVEGVARTITTPTQLGGTRHLSAAQFVHDQRDASALVASQDGRFTIFKWSPCEEIVHAHRVDALLL
jgi:hypothetical protein